MTEPPLPQRQSLAVALRRLREDAGLTTRDLADLLGVSQSRVSKVENARSSAKPEFVTAWVRATGGPDELVAQLREQARFAQSESAVWRSRKPGGLVGQQRSIGDLESQATLVCTFQPAQIPGSLQVAGYARRVFTFTDVPAEELGAAVAARMQRQAVLYDPAKRFEFVITEPALRWRVAPPHVMLAQIRHIESAMTLSTVRLGLIALDSEVVDIYQHPFILYEGVEDEDDAVVLVETWATLNVVTDPSQIEVYRKAFSRLQGAALHDDDARALLNQVAEDLRPAS